MTAGFILKLVLSLSGLFLTAITATAEERWSNNYQDGDIVAAEMSRNNRHFAWVFAEGRTVLRINGAVVFEGAGKEIISPRTIAISEDGNSIAFRVTQKGAMPGGIDYLHINILHWNESQRWSLKTVMSKSELPNPLFTVSDIGAISSSGNTILVRMGEKEESDNGLHAAYFWQTWDVATMTKVSEGFSIRAKE